MLNQFLTPEGAKLVQKYLGRTWAAFTFTAIIGGTIGYVIHQHLDKKESNNKTK